MELKAELKAKIEAIIYAAEEPITVEQIALLVKDIVLACDSATDSGAAEAAAAGETSGAGAVEAGTPSESAAVDATRDTAVSQADESAEDVTAEVKDISQADAASVEVAIETEPEQAGVAAPAQNLGKRVATGKQRSPGAPASR